MLLLLASLLGSYFNIPVVDLPGQQILAHREVDFFGMRYAVPVVVNWPGTIIAVNVGGAAGPRRRVALPADQERSLGSWR